MSPGFTVGRLLVVRAAEPQHVGDERQRRSAWWVQCLGCGKRWVIQQRVLRRKGETAGCGDRQCERRWEWTRAARAARAVVEERLAAAGLASEAIAAIVADLEKAAEEKASEDTGEVSSPLAKVGT